MSDLSELAALTIAGREGAAALVGHLMAHNVGEITAAQVIVSPWVSKIAESPDARTGWGLVAIKDPTTCINQGDRFFDGHCTIKGVHLKVESQDGITWYASAPIVEADPEYLQKIAALAVIEDLANGNK